MQRHHSTATSRNSVQETTHELNPYGQDSYSIPAALFKCAELHHVAAIVYARLARYVGKNGAQCFPALATIAKDLRLGVRQVRRHVKQLEDLGFIERVAATRPNGSQTTNRFRFLDHPVFSSEGWRSQKTSLPRSRKTAPEVKSNEAKNKEKVKGDLEQLPPFRNTSETAPASAPAQCQTQSQNLNTPELASELERYFGEKPSARTLEQIAQKAREYHVTAADVGSLLRSLEREGYGRKDRKRPHAWAWVLTTITDRLQRRKAQLEAHQMAGEHHWSQKHAAPPLCAADVLPMDAIELDTEVTHALFRTQAA